MDVQIYRESHDAAVTDHEASVLSQCSSLSAGHQANDQNLEKSFGPFCHLKAMFLPENKQLQQRGLLQLCEEFMSGSILACFKEEVQIEVGC